MPAVKGDGTDWQEEFLEPSPEQSEAPMVQSMGRDTGSEADGSGAFGDLESPAQQQQQRQHSFCSDCGSPLLEQQQFCGKCGTPNPLFSA